MNIPKPKDEEFVAKVQAELAEATERAMISWAERGRRPKGKRSPLMKPIVPTRREWFGVCKGCGANYDEYAVGCRVCMNRHKRRRYDDKLIRERELSCA